MKIYQYELQPYQGVKSRFICPACGKDRQFTLYVDRQTNEPIAAHVGKCNRESSCGYHYTPRQYFESNDNGGVAANDYRKMSSSRVCLMPTPKNGNKMKPISTIDYDVFKASLCSYERNHFVQYLINLFGSAVASELIGRYFIGTSKHWDGATVFWQIDQCGKIRAGKIMLYNAQTGRRVKEPMNMIGWVHSVLELDNYNLCQCLFGEHLLRCNSKTVAIVESEKTAIIASAYLPEYVWLATGGLGNLTEEKCRALNGRRVLLYPDLNGFEKWSIRAKELAHVARFAVSDLLEVHATESERALGLDLADYLIRRPAPVRIVGALNGYKNQLVELSARFTSGEISLTTYGACCEKLEVQIKSEGIALADIVKMTSAVEVG